MQELAHRTPSGLYKDYGVFLGYFDDASAMRVGPNGAFDNTRIQGVRDRFRGHCQTFLSEQSQSSEAASHEDAVSLYHPKFATALGHYDDLSVVLVDDFASFAELAAWTPELESYSLASVPCAGHYSKDPSCLPPHYIEPKRLFKKNTNLEDALDGPPLLAVTHLKLAGIGTLAFGAHLQSALIEAILQRVESTLASGADTAERADGSVILPASAFESTKFTLLEPLSADDLILVTLTHNYSVAATVIAALRNLTFADLTDDVAYGEWKPSRRYRDRLAKSVANDRITSFTDISHTSLLQAFIGGSYSKKPPKSITEALRSNHLLVSSYTTLGVNASLSSISNEAASVTGAVSVHSFIDVSPGHEHEASKNLQEESPSSSSATQEITLSKCEDWRQILTGHHDMLFTLAPQHGALFNPKLTTTEHLLRCMHSWFSQNVSADGEEEVSTNDSGVFDLSTYLGVPVLSFGKGIREEDSAAQDAYACILRYLKPAKKDGNASFPLVSRLRSLQATVASSFSGGRSDAFQRGLKALGLPASTRALATRSYGDYLSAIADPLTYDAVLDLSDAFMAFHKYIETRSETLTKEEIQGAKFPLGSRKARRFAIKYINDLRVALHARLGWAAARHDGYFSRDDVKGSLAGLYGATDAVSKCSVGIARTVSRLSEPLSDSSKISCTALVAARLSYSPSVHYLIAKQPSMALASIRMDVPHLFRLYNLVGIVHEIGHLILETYVLPEVQSLSGEEGRWQDTPLLTAAGNGINSRSLAGEYCAEAFVAYCVFSNDPDGYLSYALSVFLTAQLEEADDVQVEGDAVLYKYAAYMHRVYTVYKWILSALTPSSNAEDEQEDFCDEFISYGTDAWERIPTVVNFAPDAVEAMLDGVCAQGREERSWATTYILPRVQEAVESVLGSRLTERDELRDLTRKSCTTGVPFFMADLAGGSREFDESEIVFLTLQHYVDITIKACLPQVGKDATQEAFYDPCDARVGFHSPAARRNLFASQVVLNKTLWHLSTRQRMRRLHELCCDGNTHNS